MRLLSPRFRRLYFFLFLPAFLFACLYFPVKIKSKPQELNGRDSLFLFAHRGVCESFAENSLPAFQLADSLDFPGLEMDIRMTADSELVIFHDPDGKRLLGRDLLIASTLLDSLQQCTLLPGSNQSSGKVMSLREYFSLFHDRFLVYLDIKPLDGSIKYLEARQLLKLLKECNTLPSVIVANYDIRFLAYLKIKDPKVKTVLEGFNEGKEWIWSLVPRRWKPDYLSSFSSRVTTKQVGWLKKKELFGRRIIYEVDSTNFETVLKIGVPGMIIDYFPGLDAWLKGKQ
jgi:glycerophosphoryl diester phosphodiesterase